MSLMNQDNPYAMNQTCKVCGEPAAGFHFGAFTCEGCKSFFGRSYNNLSSISDCKNNGECIINKKNRTACKACRLRKCLMVGMSKSGSRYGRRSNWFKIHCLLQEQQQQAAAAMAAHQQHQANSSGCAVGPGTKHHHGSISGVPQPAAAAAALGMLGHGGYSGLYAAAAGASRSKEELMMLGLEDYAAAAASKHPAASPSVSSPESHNSDSSVEISVRGNPLLHLAGKHTTLSPATSGESSTPGSTGLAATTHHSAPAHSAPQLRKDIPPYLQLPFPGLSSMPVMPPPAFLPPSHLLFPGYHPALYSHHQSLLKPTPEQQQAAAAAAAVQHLFNSSNAGRFGHALPSSGVTTQTALTPAVTPHSPFAVVATNKQMTDQDACGTSPKSDTINNNHIPNGSKAAEELTKRFYLDAVLKSQQHSPPPVATMIPTHTKHDHSISALVTPNSESGRELLKSRQSNGDEEEREECVDNMQDRAPEAEEEIVADIESDCCEEEDLVVSMTPPCSPPMKARAVQSTLISQDNPIDLSMKTCSSVSSSLSSKCSSTGSLPATDESDQEDYTNKSMTTRNQNMMNDVNEELEVREHVDDEEDNSTTETVKTTIVQSKLNNNNNNSSDTEDRQPHFNLINDGVSKRKLHELVKQTETELSSSVETKRLKHTIEAVSVEMTSTQVAVKVTTASVLDLSTKA